MVRDGQIPLVSLEENADRIRNRVAREHRPMATALERINGIANFQDKVVLDKLAEMAKSVCRILKRGNPIGTGFLIADGLIMTNHHVIENESDAYDMLAEFNYELDFDLNPKTTACFKLDSAKFFLTSSLDEDKNVPNSGLDFTIIAVDRAGTKGESIVPFTPVLLDGNTGKIIKGESCVIIQHPSGLPKKIVLKDTAFFSETGTRIVYESDTLNGSSGSCVIGLGTCEVIALHHMGLPRTDEQNRPLTKAGTLADANTPDDQIDWYANEGIKVSCIVQAVKEASLPPGMEELRQAILRKTEVVKETLVNTTIPVQPISTPVSSIMPSSTVSRPVPTPSLPAASPLRGGPLQYFEILLSNDQNLRDDWDLHAADLVPGFVETRRLISDSTESISERMEYLTVASTEDPWTLAAQIESLTQVETCVPDLESYTDVGIAAAVNPDNTYEEALAGARYESVIYNDGTASMKDVKKIESDFADSRWFKEAKAMDAARYPNYQRQWNWLSINCPADDMRAAGIWPGIQENLKKLRYVQLDTGYSRHSKSYSGYDLDKDFDFIDNDTDAADITDRLSDRLLLKFPFHGTRTASLTVGNKLSADPDSADGNSGLLTFAGQNPVRLIPYRIARSVILIGRGAEMVNAASYAIQNNTDVMFMCMGSYPRPMFEVIAREAYKRGVIWVCAAGNEVEMVVAPAMYPGTIAVAAVNPKDEPWSGSSNGAVVDIAAPGEAVYVPFIDKHGNEIMVYGDGTSYATPQVASAAMLWKAKNLEEIKTKYKEPWQIVEAFRITLKATARRPEAWPEKNYKLYGQGILDIGALLAAPLPDPGAPDFRNAYDGVPEVDRKDLGIREAAHYIWNVFKRKLRGGPTESAAPWLQLSERAKIAMRAYAPVQKKTSLESLPGMDAVDDEKFLRNFFNQ